MDQTKFTTFRLEVTLKSSAIIQGPLTLESLCAASVFESTGLMREEALALVPIASEMVNGFRVWQASSVCFEGHIRRGIEVIPRRLRRSEIGPEFFDGNSRVRKGDPWGVEQGKGNYKALLNSYPTIQAERLVWVASGDAHACAEMIRDLMFIGKRRGQGFGQISSVSLMPSLEHPVIDINGFVRRPIPVEMLSYLTAAKPESEQKIAFVPVSHPTWASPAIRCAVANEMQAHAKNGLVESEVEEFFE